MNLDLLAQLRRHRLQAHAVRLLHAIAAAFADLLVDHQPHRGLFQGPARPLPALLRGALLVVDDHRDAFYLLQFAQSLGQLRPRAEHRVRRELAHVLVLLGLLRQHHGALHALGLQLAGQLRNRQRARGDLAAGHRDVPVVQDLVGDVHARRDAGFHRQRAGMEQRAVADVLEDVLLVHERRHADPGRAFAAHLRDELHVAARVAQAHRHGVAADSARPPSALPAAASSGYAGTPNRTPRRAIGSSSRRAWLRHGRARSRAQTERRVSSRAPARSGPDRVRPVGGKCDLPSDLRTGRRSCRGSRAAASPGSCASPRPP